MFFITFLSFILSVFMICNAFVVTKNIEAIISFIFGFIFAALFVVMIFFVVEDRIDKRFSKLKEE